MGEVLSPAIVAAAGPGSGRVQHLFSADGEVDAETLQLALLKAIGPERYCGGVRGAGEAPWFVVAKDLPGNTLTVAQGHDHPALLSTVLEASQLSWVAGEAPALPHHCTARTRYRQPDQACVIESLAQGTSVVRFAQPQRAVTPGQSVVFYDGERCLGGGIIDVTHPA